MTCVFCYNVWKNKKKKDSKKKHLIPKQQLKIIDKLAKMNIFGLIISGGEPLISKNIFEIIERASKKHKIETSIITNGALLTKENCRRLKESGLLDMQISLHSCDEKSNDQITGIKGSYKKTITGIKNALKFFQPEDINVNMVPTKKTYNQVYNTAKFLKKLGIINFTVSSYIYSGNKKLDDLLAPTRKNFQEIYDQVVRIKNKLFMHTFIGGCYPLCCLSKIDNKTISLIGNICDAGVTQMVISPEGDIRPCVAYNHVLGNILKENPINIWRNSLILNKIRRMENIPTMCKKCKYLVFCRGGCRASAYNERQKLNDVHQLLKNG